MGCGCHGDSRKSTSEVRPYDQCLICARKHVVQAWQAWHEFGHELDNRDFCSAELRACAAHVKYIERDIAIEGRDIAKAIEMFEDGGIAPAPSATHSAISGGVDGGIAERIDGLRVRVEEAMLRRYPELAERYERIKEHR